jgi:hypothetical protein
VRARYFRVSLLAASDKSTIADLERILKNYHTENWDQFRKGISEYLPNLPVEKPIDMNRALYQLLELAMMGLVTSDTHMEFITNVHELLVHVGEQHPQALRVFIDACVAGTALRQTQFDLCSLVPRFLKRQDELRQAIVEWDPDHPLAPFPHGLRVNTTARYHELKGLYVDTYEALARSLTFVTGLSNLNARGDHDAYPSHPTLKRYAPASMADFRDKDHAPKPGLLSTDPVFGPWIDGALDSKLRNAIGHNTLELDQRTEQMTYPTNRQRTNFATISYGEFHMRLLRVSCRAHQSNHVIKMLLVHHLLGWPQSAAAGTPPPP